MRIPPIARLAAPALILQALVLTPFLGKAFTIDDTIFLAQARHALSDPLHPSAFDLEWPVGWADAPSRVSRWPHGPLMAWLLTPAVAMGGDEHVAHLVSFFSLAMAVVATVALGVRLGCTPRAARVSGLLLVAMPAVLGMAGTAMPDVLAMSLGTAGLERLVAWTDDRRTGTGLSASVLLGLAPMARPHAILLLLVGALLVLGAANAAARRFRWIDGIPLVLAVLLSGLVTWVTRDPNPGGAGLVAATIEFGMTEALSENVLGFFIHWALAMVFVLPWAVVRWKSLVARWWLVAGFVLVAVALLRHAHPSSPRYPFAPVVGISAAVLVDVIGGAIAERDVRKIALAIWLLLPLVVAVYVHFPPKYLVLSAPAASVLLAQVADGGRRLERGAVGAAGLAGIALGVLILRADAAFAEVGRVAAATLVRPNVEAGRRVWFVGHWGFQWYAEKAGGRVLDQRSAPRPGDLIARARNDTSGEFTEDALRRLVRIASIEERRPGGRILSKEDGAGFYGNRWGYLPWSWGDGLADAVDLWLVTP